MGRTKKKVKEVAPVVGAVEVKEVAPVVGAVEVKEVAPVEPNTPVASKVTYSILASFKTRNVDGDKITHKYKGAGSTLAEALDIVGSEEDLADEFDRPFPKGINLNVVITVRTSKGYEYSRNVAPHVARDIFEGKNIALATKLLLA
jgi:hypothetical protein